MCPTASQQQLYIYCKCKGNNSSVRMTTVLKIYKYMKRSSLGRGSMTASHLQRRGAPQRCVRVHDVSRKSVQHSHVHICTRHERVFVTVLMSRGVPQPRSIFSWRSRMISIPIPQLIIARLNVKHNATSCRHLRRLEEIILREFYRPAFF